MYNRFGGTVGGLFDYISQRSIPMINSSGVYPRLNTIDDYLGYKGIQISSVMNGFDACVSSISSQYFYAKGYWEYQNEILDYVGGYTRYHFELQVSDVSDFSNILFTIDSSLDNSGWYYENAQGSFDNLDSSGISSAYVGRSIKYKSDAAYYLSRGYTYYYRIRQKSVEGVSAYRNSSDTIWT
jgi:hypothetical protein